MLYIVTIEKTISMLMLLKYYMLNINFQKNSRDWFGKNIFFTGILRYKFYCSLFEINYTLLRFHFFNFEMILFKFEYCF